MNTNSPHRSSPPCQANRAVWKKQPPVSASGLRHHQRGINLIELMIGLALSLFLMLGLFSIFDTTRQTYSAQTGLAQIQEKQRASISLISGIIQSTGYFPVSTGLVLSPDPVLVRNNTFPAISGAYVKGATIFGTEGATSSDADTLRVRFQTASGDNIPNCQGNANTTGSNVIYDNQFSITANNELACAIGINGGAAGTATVLIDGVSNLQILYGFDTSGSGSVTKYVDAGFVTDWKKVRSLKITLTFVNPNASQPGQPASIVSTQVIQLMGNS